MHRVGSFGNAAPGFPLTPGFAPERGTVDKEDVAEIRVEDVDDPKMTALHRDRERLRIALEHAREEIDTAEATQTAQTGIEFESALAFAQEVGIRIFLYNIVKMLLVIALVAADASICVWTMFHFGIVIGLSVVMVINVALAVLFGFFVLRYTERERGMMHMEYGQHAFKNVTDLFDQNNIKGLGESLAMITRQIQGGGGGNDDAMGDDSHRARHEVKNGANRVGVDIA